MYPRLSLALCTLVSLAFQVGKANNDLVGTGLDPIQLAIFSHRFMSIAEQMGRILQKTSISTNIKVTFLVSN